MSTRSTIRNVAVLAVVATLLAGCQLHLRVQFLASDDLNGRENDSPGGIAARSSSSPG